ncbi:MAG: hypothetical protein A3F67_09810 [Verrucomicrobia bacterium RIFCSPHIGHO2_12_FULL_41_10]|nr:MAG: hypothetical protein A3F67_09810 [Verrucomicrobia bacterium RIFCSPHIGHO2_12_FULL_41_10]
MSKHKKEIQIRRSLHWGMLLIAGLLSIQQAMIYFSELFAIFQSWPLSWIVLGLSVFMVIWPRGVYSIGCLPWRCFVFSKFLLHFFVPALVFYGLLAPMAWVLRSLYPQRFYFKKRQDKQRATYWEPYDSSLVKRRDWRAI